MAGERTPPLLHPALGRGWRSGPLERGAKPSPSPAGTWGAPQPPLLYVPGWEGKRPGDGRCRGLGTLGSELPRGPEASRARPWLRPWEVRVGRRRPEALSRVGRTGADSLGLIEGRNAFLSRPRSAEMLASSSPPPTPHPPCSDSAGARGRPLPPWAGLFFFF